MQRKIFLYLLFILGCTNNALKAQTIRDEMTKSYPTCNDVYINALNVLPKLYRRNVFDSMYIALDIWKEACGDIPEIKYTTLLLSIDQATFKDSVLDSSIIDLLVNYSNSYHFIQRNRGIYYEREKSFYKFSSGWASLIIKSKMLNENERLICKVFTDEISDPAFEIKTNPEKYLLFTKLIKQHEEAQRKQPRSNTTLMTGIWMPTGKLKLLGSHPSAGFQFGLRKGRNQTDFTVQLRFLKSASTFLVNRNNTLYESDAYFGGYIGLDYTYFLATSGQVEFGLMGGLGYDGFDLFKSTGNYQYLRPLSIGSLNLNGGLKFNFFMSSVFYFGLQGRYNWIHYNNKGGTDMGGNAFSIDLLFGKYRMQRR